MQRGKAGTLIVRVSTGLQQFYSEIEMAVLHREGSSAARLIRLAQDEGSDLLVTGGYGHSRLGEWVFGGVTEELLATSPISCLMSH